MKTAGMLHWSGDCNPRHNLACEPQLPPITGFFFLVGVAISLAGVFGRDGKRETIAWTGYGLLPIWLIFFAMPSAFTWEGVPHALRSIGMIPAVFLFAAIGLDATYALLRHRKVLRIILMTAVLGSSLFEYHRYFGIWARQPATSEAFSHRLVSVAAYLNTLPAETPRFVVVNDYWELTPLYDFSDKPGVPHKNVYLPAQTVIFLTYGHPPPVYLNVEEVFEASFPPGSVVVPLINDPRIFSALRERGLDLAEETHAETTSAWIR